MKALDMKTLNKKTTLTDWVAALRSGKYKQQKGTLRGSRGYCCIGVLCAINGVDLTINVRTPEQGLFEGPEELYEFARKLSSAEIVDDGISMNDDGQSFEAIANYIEGAARGY